MCSFFDLVSLMTCKIGKFNLISATVQRSLTNERGRILLQVNFNVVFIAVFYVNNGFFSVDQNCA